LSGDERGPLTGAPKPNCISCPSNENWFPGATVAGQKRCDHLGLAIGLAAQPVAKSPHLGSFERSRRGGDVIGKLVR